MKPAPRLPRRSQGGEGPCKTHPCQRVDEISAEPSRPRLPSQTVEPGQRHHWNCRWWQHPHLTSKPESTIFVRHPKIGHNKIGTKTPQRPERFKR